MLKRSPGAALAEGSSKRSSVRVDVFVNVKLKPGTVSETLYTRTGNSLGKHDADYMAAPNSEGGFKFFFPSFCPQVHPLFPPPRHGNSTLDRWRARYRSPIFRYPCTDALFDNRIDVLGSNSAPPRGPFVNYNFGSAFKVRGAKSKHDTLRHNPAPSRAPYLSIEYTMLHGILSRGRDIPIVL